jgi:predicted HicB family RNase H-like nuclease
VTPNKPKTPTTNFRIPAYIKEPAQAKAAAEGKTLTDVVLDLLRDYIRD